MISDFELLDIAFGAGGILVIGSFLYLVWLVIKHRELELDTDSERFRRRMTKTDRNVIV